MRYQNGLNDVMSDVFRGNYRLYLHQIDANQTSQGYWRIGPKHEPYGRFARGFNHDEGKNTILLDIEDSFFGGEPLSGAYPVMVNIIFFDSGNGRWELRYDSKDNKDKVGLSVENSNTNRWITASVFLKDAYFGNRGTAGSDISIVNADSLANIFHMVEITR